MRWKHEPWPWFAYMCAMVVEGDGHPPTRSELQWPMPRFPCIDSIHDGLSMARIGLFDGRYP